MSKGFNSILFDFDSIIDKELSILNFLREEYRESTIRWFDKSRLICLDNSSLEFYRLYGKEDLFKSFIIDEKLKESSDDILNSIFDRDQSDILKNGYAYSTAMKYLISAYKKAGSGVIRTAVRCDNDDQKSYITQNFDVDTIIKSRSDIEMSKYGRLIVGSYTSALEYRLNEPKSILVLNFRENFDSKDITLLNPELVIKLGDIHDIGVISAFREDPNIKG